LGAKDLRVKVRFAVGDANDPAVHSIERKQRERRIVAVAEKMIGKTCWLEGDFTVHSNILWPFMLSTDISTSLPRRHILLL
jgi:hypothetical protein